MLQVTSQSAWLNKYKSIVGTPSYIAVEVLESQIYSPACDLWACGAIIYFMLHGLPPFASADGADHILRRILKDAALAG